MAQVLVVGLNPAWQRVLILDRLQVGGVNRAREVRELAAGKGANVAKALSRLGHTVWLLQILAGETGRRCRDACAAWGLRNLPVWVRGETRVCTTVVSPDCGATELIEPFAISEPDLENALQSVLPPPAWDAVVICGTIPSGVPDSAHAAVIAHTGNAPVFWDSVAGLRPEILPRLAWIKVNTEEYTRLRPVVEATAGPTPPARLVTAGAGAARVFGAGPADGVYRLPALGTLVSPIGAGDTVTAGLTDGVLRGWDAAAAVRRALALGAASCATPLPAEWDAERARDLEAGVAREPA